MTITTLNKKSNPNALLKTVPIRLDHNENPLGASPLAIKAAQRALIDCHRYPSQEEALKMSLAMQLSVHPQAIKLGNGSEGLLELIGKTYLTSKNSAVLPNYSFTGIKKIILSSGARLITAANSVEHITAAQILAAVESTTKIIFIVNPNNPSGTYINSIDLSYLLDNLTSDILVVIDEAYVEYSDALDYPNTIKLLHKYPNLIISRTFSKFYGLAGLRLGYTISHSEITSHLNRVCLPFSVNSVVLAAAQAALYDHEHNRLSRLINQHGRSQLIQGLKNLSLTAIPSQTNFVCVDLKQNSLPIYKQLLNDGIQVRLLGDYGLSRHLRISIGLEEQNQQLLNALYKIL